jgi:hypothetical protein
MIDTQQMEVLELGRRKFNEFIDGCLEIVAGEADAVVDRAAADRPTHGYQARHGSWSLDDETLTIEWKETGRQTDATYRWPDGNLDQYDRFVTYHGSNDDGSGFTLALGYLLNGDVVGFVLGTGGGAERGITYFFPADDATTTHEKVSMIRGGGETGRAGFKPGEALPQAYAGIKTDVLRDRVAGKWNVQAVVAKEDDFETMLNHTAIQARLRGLA